MPFVRVRRSIQGQGGSTMIELLVAMPIAVLLLGISIGSLGSSGRSQRDIENRTETLTRGQLGLERMTREIRQATWVYFRSSSVIDLEAKVRDGASATSARRLVRYDCSTDVCTRSEGPATLYPPPASPTFATTVEVIGGQSTDPGNRYGRIVGHDVFRPSRIDPTTGVSTPDYSQPNFLQISVNLAITSRQNPLELEDGVALRNRSTFAG